MGAYVQIFDVDARQATDKVGGEVNSLIEGLASQIEATQQTLTMLNNLVQDIWGRVQSIVFVPEYSDGEATIDYAYFGSTVIEGRSTLEYQVYPAACAAVIAKEMLAYDVVPVSTRAGEALTVVDVKGEEKKNLTIEQLLQLFEASSGSQFTSDKVMLSK